MYRRHGTTIHHIYGCSPSWLATGRWGYFTREWYMWDRTRTTLIYFTPVRSAMQICFLFLSLFGHLCESPLGSQTEMWLTQHGNKPHSSSHLHSHCLCCSHTHTHTSKALGMVTFPLSGMLSALKQQCWNIGIQRAQRSQRPARGHTDPAGDTEMKWFLGVQTAGIINCTC